MPVQSYAPYGAVKQRSRSRTGVKQGSNGRISIKNRPQQGKTVGHYMLGKTLGEGTFGKVKTGTHILTGEKVAVKVLEKSRIVEKADVTRVAREIKILKRNLHHNVIQLFEVLDTPATIYLIMENADRGELFDYIVAHQRVEEPQACYFFHQIIDGVDYLHSMEVTHRDLKPENLLLQISARGLVVKIVDFGLSNTHDGGRQLKTACGSPCYAAPEMIAGNGEKYYEGPKADIWSIGVILFALVCGYLPFEDANTSKLYKKILAGDYSTPKWISTEVKDLITNILNTDPATRYTIANIRAHVWYNRIDMKQAPAVDKPGEGEIDEAVVEECEKLGLKRQALMESIVAGHHNNATTTYYLLKKKLFRELSCSVRASTVPPKRQHDNSNQSHRVELQQAYQENQIQMPRHQIKGGQKIQQVPYARTIAVPMVQPPSSNITGTPVIRIANTNGIKVRNVRSRGSARSGQSRVVHVPRLKIPARGGANQRQTSTLREYAMEASKTARAYRAKPATKIVSKHQYPSSARAVYESIGIEQLVAPHNSLMAPRPGYVPKPQAPTGAPRRPQQFAGHNGRRVSESAKSSNNVETIDRPRTRGASRGASRDDTQTPQIDRPLGATQHGVQ